MTLLPQPIVAPASQVAPQPQAAAAAFPGPSSPLSFAATLRNPHVPRGEALKTAAASDTAAAALCPRASQDRSPVSKRRAPKRVQSPSQVECAQCGP